MIEHVCHVDEEGNAIGKVTRKEMREKRFSRMAISTCLQYTGLKEGKDKPAKIRSSNQEDNM